MTVLEPQQSTESARLAGSDAQELEPVDHYSGTAVAVTLDFVGGTLPQSDLLLEQLGLGPGAPGLPGSLFEWSRSSVDGLRIVEVWQSQRHFDYFFAREILPAIGRIGMPRPAVTTYPVHNYLVPGPSVAIPEEDVCAGSVDR